MVQKQQFGDDKDRVLRQSNGDLTYVTTDIAYHYGRGFDLLVDVLGADSHGYVTPTTHRRRPAGSQT